MRNILLLLVALWSLLLTSCEEHGVTVFDDSHEIYFDKFFMDARAPGKETADSTEVSFFFAAEDEKYADAILVVHLSGRALTEDLHFGLRVVPEETTALPTEYILEDSYTFHARPIPEDATVIKDSIVIRFARSERLADIPQGIRLMVELVGNADVGVGQYERSRAILLLRENDIRPDWWDQEIEAWLLGTYSSKKYKYFLQNIEGARELDGNMIQNRPDQARKLVKAFKKWLDNQNPPIYEENGELMRVEV